MKTILALTALASIFLYQNCAPFHGRQDVDFINGLLSVADIYPYYRAKPVYFSDVQLVAVDDEGAHWNYAFHAAVVDVDLPDNPIDVVIEVKDLAGLPVCPRLETTGISRSNNHIVLDQCRSEGKKDGLVVEVLAAPQDGSLVKISEFSFFVKNL